MHSSMIEPAAAVAPPAPDRAALTLRVAGAGTLLVLVVFTTVISTVRDTAAALHAGESWQAWALSAMSVGLAAALLTVGAAADAIGRRRAFVLGSAALAAASAAAAAAPTIALFVAARVVQGLAGAAVLASALALIAHAFPAGAQRTRATGAWGAMVGAGIALGPLVGAALALTTGWRAAYWLEAACALALAAIGRVLDESRSPASRSVALPSAAALAGAMTALTAALISARQGWTSRPTVALLAGGVVLAAAFALVERRRAAPMLDLSLFRERAFVAATSGALFTGLAVIGLLSYLPTFLQRGLHMTTLGSAGVLAVWSATSAIVALQARRLPARLDSRRRLVAGLLLCAAGEAGLTGLTTGSSWWQLVPGLLVAGIGSGLANAALGRLAVASVPAQRAAMGSGANNTARYLGGAAGVAVAVTIATAGHGRGGAGAVVGWNVAAIVAAGLSLVGAAIAAVAARDRQGAGAVALERLHEDSSL